MKPIDNLADLVCDLANEVLCATEAYGMIPDDEANKRHADASATYDTFKAVLTAAKAALAANCPAYYDLGDALARSKKRARTDTEFAVEMVSCGWVPTGVNLTTSPGDWVQLYND